MTDTSVQTALDLTPAVQRITKDLREAVKTLNVQEARYLVDYYYQMQEDRKRSANQERAVKDGADTEGPSGAVAWLAAQGRCMESRVRTFLDIYSGHHPLGIWARSNVGIGPVIAAGLLAHIDMAQAPTAGHIWSFAGLDPRVKWTGATETAKELEACLGGRPDKVSYEHLVMACEHFRRKPATIERYAKPLNWTTLVKALNRRPWNTPLKTLCWKIGESFCKVSGNPDAFYGKLYAEYRVEEDRRNIAGEYIQQAYDKLERFKIGKDTDAHLWYAGCLTSVNAKDIRKAESSKRMGMAKKLAGDPGSGQPMLPPAHLFARAKRRVVKLFLSHYHHVGYMLSHDGEEPPRPWALCQGGHTHFIPPPNLDKL